MTKTESADERCLQKSDVTRISWSIHNRPAFTRRSAAMSEVQKSNTAATVKTLRERRIEKTKNAIDVLRRLRCHNSIWKKS